MWRQCSTVSLSVKSALPPPPLILMYSESNSETLQIGLCLHASQLALEPAQTPATTAFWLFCERHCCHSCASFMLRVGVSPTRMSDTVEVLKYEHFMVMLFSLGLIRICTEKSRFISFPDQLQIDQLQIMQAEKLWQFWTQFDLTGYSTVTIPCRATVYQGPYVFQWQFVRLGSSWEELMLPKTQENQLFVGDYGSDPKILDIIQNCSSLAVAKSQIAIAVLSLVLYSRNIQSHWIQSTTEKGHKQLGRWTAVSSIAARGWYDHTNSSVLPTATDA